MNELQKFVLNYPKLNSGIETRVYSRSPYITMRYTTEIHDDYPEIRVWIDDKSPSKAIITIKDPGFLVQNSTSMFIYNGTEREVRRFSESFMTIEECIKYALLMERI